MIKIINKVNIFLGAFISILIGVSLITIVADQVYLNRNTIPVSHETIAIASGAGSTTFDRLESVTFFGNGTNNTEGSLTINSDVNWTRDGDIYVGADLVDANYNISYAYGEDQYITGSSSARSLMNLLVIFFALALITIPLIFVVKELKETGLF